MSDYHSERTKLADLEDKCHWRVGRMEGPAPEMGGPRARQKLRAPYSKIAKNLRQGQQNISQGPSVGVCVCGGGPLIHRRNCGSAFLLRGSGSRRWHRGRLLRESLSGDNSAPGKFRDFSWILIMLVSTSEWCYRCLREAAGWKDISRETPIKIESQPSDIHNSLLLYRKEDATHIGR